MECHREVGLDFNPASINRAHRVGKPSTQSGKKKQAVIVQFRSWGARCAFFQKRPKFTKTTPGAARVQRKFSVSLDLTKRRVDLLNSARELIQNYPEVSYAYNDINCALVLKVGENKRHFNTEDQLLNILSKCKYVASENLDTTS